MPRGPKGEKRPADVIGAAVMVARIATGEIEENESPDLAAAATRDRRPPHVEWKSPSQKGPGRSWQCFAR